MNTDDAIELLNQHSDYKVLRRLEPRTVYSSPEPEGAKLGVYLDVETTGLNFLEDEIIEIALVPFTFGSDGTLYRCLEPLNMLQEPVSGEIPEEITKITGIRIEDVRGHKIDWEEVRSMIAPAVLIVAHNAGFDRKFCERAEPMFSTKSWACSFKDVDWRAEGFESAKLEYLGLKSGFFFEGHRATIDCQAGLELLSRELPVSGDRALAAMLSNARQTTYRIWAENAPYDFKDYLKRRGYIWNDGSDGRPRAWFADLNEEALPEEVSWLQSDIYQSEDVEPLITKFNSFDRYSTRV